MFGTKSLGGGGPLVAASAALALVLFANRPGPATRAHLDFSTATATPPGEVGPGFGTFPDFPEPAVGPFPDTRGMRFRGQLVPSRSTQ